MDPNASEVRRTSVLQVLELVGKSQVTRSLLRPMYLKIPAGKNERPAKSLSATRVLVG